MMTFQPLFDQAQGRFPIAVIAGPCSAETPEQLLATAEQLAALGVGIFRAGLWKPRTMPGGFEGVGEQGLPWLQQVRKQTGMRLAVEVATEEHVRAALDADIDVLWLGARTVTNPFAVQQIADALRGSDVAVLVKNPMSPDVKLWIGTIERLYAAGIRRLGAIHRGFGPNERYRNAPQWHVPIELHRRLPSLPLFSDPSHISGRRDLIEDVARQAMELHFDGLMIESHCAPDEALSDAAQQITPDVLAQILQCLPQRRSTCPDEALLALRHQIDDCDSDLFAILAKRMNISQEIGRYKLAHNLPVLQPDRYEALLKSRLEEGSDYHISPQFVQTIFEAIHEESVRIQLEERNTASDSDTK